MPKGIDPETFSPFGAVFWEIAESRGIERNQSAAARYFAERGQQILKQHIQRYTRKKELGGIRPPPWFAHRVVVGLELDFPEQVALAWAELYGERVPPEIARRLDVVEDIYERLLGEEESSEHSTSSNSTSETPETNE